MFDQHADVKGVDVERMPARPPPAGPRHGPPHGPRRDDPPVGRAGRLANLVAVAVGLVVAAAGVVGGVLWAVAPSAVPTLDGAGPVPPENVAAATVAGLALALLAGRPAPVRRVVGKGLAALTAALGAFGVAEQIHYFSAPLLALRRLLTGEAVDAPLMTPGTATALLLLGGALVTLDRPINRRLPWTQALAPAAAAIALVPALSYVHAVTRDQADVSEMIVMPAPSAVALLLVALGTMCARCDRGLVRPFGSSGGGAALARQLTPALILLPLGVVLLSVLIIRLADSRTSLAFALSTAAAVIVLVFIIARAVFAVDSAEERQRRLLDDLAAERDFTDTLLQSLSEAVIVFAPDLRVVDANARACRLLDRSADDVVGQRPPYPWQPDGDVTPSLAGDTPAGDRHLLRPDGSRVPVLARTAPVLDGEGRPRAFVGTFVDITGLKEADAALAERAAALEAINEELRDSNRRLGEAAEFRQELMSMMSHEVSQPLSSVASLAELLASDWADLPDETREELTRKIDNNARRLTRMINDMLLLLRLEAGAVTARREPVPVTEVVDSVVDSAPAAAQLVTSVDQDVFALVDRGHLWQALGNLVSNAMTYGEPPIEITSRRTADGVLIEVRDYGHGIPEEDVPHLFEHARKRSRERRTKGSGLGLFIVRHLVEANGGRVWYERAEPQGARVVIRLEPAPGMQPAATPAPAGAAPQTPTSAAPQTAGTAPGAASRRERA